MIVRELMRLWLIGMVVFSNALHRLGLMGMPRRTQIAAAPYLTAEWKALLPLVGIGGTLLFISAMLYFLNLALTVVASRKPYSGTVMFAEALSGPDHAPVLFDRWKPWLVLAFVLIVLAYGPSLLQLAATTPFDAPGLRVW